MTFRGIILAAAIAVGSLAHAQNDKTVGWRGDGTGRYPDANPPTVWYKKDTGESKNILWQVKLPCYSWATPIIVGNKILVRSDPYDLICLDKNTGKILWIRSHPPFVAVTEQEKAANPAWKEIGPLVDELQKLDDEFAAQGWTADLYKKKYDLQHKINDLTAKADKKYALFPDMWVESWSGYTAETPCSDGKYIYLNSGCGAAACYDLDGNRKWVWYQNIPAEWAGEHGRYYSPALSRDKFLNPEQGVVLDKNTGKELWRPKFAEVSNQFAVVPFEMNGKEYVLWGGNFARLSPDGKTFHYVKFGDSVPVIHDGTVFYNRGGGMQWFKVEAGANDELKVTNLMKGRNEYEVIAHPPYSGKGDMGNSQYSFWVPSPLYHDGLLYCLSSWGELAVYDVEKRDLVYHKTLPFDLKNPMHRKTFGCGIGASPAFAGKHIFLMDNAGCTLVIEPGREYKEVAKNNIDYTIAKGWEPRYWADGYHEITLSTPVFDGARIYIRGEQFLYCIGEK